jgi:putative ubiquitin-RnfH superfamily antitoxin RatB of RatAB toxin-antitoxin module
VNPGPESGAVQALQLLRIEVVYALPGAQYQQQLALPPGSTVADALAAVADRDPFRRLDLAVQAVGIFGERVARERELVDHDRVELYRPLPMDPLEARRRRAQASSTTSAGTSGSVITVGVKSPEK